MIHGHTEHVTMEEIASFLLLSRLFFYSNRDLNLHFSSFLAVFYGHLSKFWPMEVSGNA